MNTPGTADPALWVLDTQTGTGERYLALTPFGLERTGKVATGLAPGPLAALEALAVLGGETAVETHHGSRIRLTPWGADHATSIGALSYRGLVELVPTDSLTPVPMRYRLTAAGRSAVARLHQERADLIARIRREVNP